MEGYKITQILTTENCVFSQGMSAATIYCSGRKDHTVDEIKFDLAGDRVVVMLRGGDRIIIPMSNVRAVYSSRLA